MAVRTTHWRMNIVVVVGGWWRNPVLDRVDVQRRRCVGHRVVDAAETAAVGLVAVMRHFCKWLHGVVLVL